MKGNCIGCGLPFVYNPRLVPTIRIHKSRYPVCRACVEWANPIRIESGIKPFLIQEGAYDEPNFNQKVKTPWLSN